MQRDATNSGFVQAFVASCCALAGFRNGLVLEGSIQCAGATSFGLRLSVDLWPSSATARLFALPQGATCQAGDFELQGSLAAPLRWTLTPSAWLSNPCSLQLLGLEGQVVMTPGRDSFQGQVRGLATACSFALTTLCGFTCSDTLAQFGGQAACTVTYSAYLSEGNDQLCKHLFMEHKRPSYTHTHTHTQTHTHTRARAHTLFVASAGARKQPRSCTAVSRPALCVHSRCS